jgi:histidyl-tRNA synthetase
VEVCLFLHRNYFFQWQCGWQLDTCNPKASDVVDKEMYTLKTKGGDHLAMRPEHTAALMRAYLEHGMQSEPQPVLFYQYGPVFRHDKPQRGRYRQFWQFDVDALGSEKSIVDALVLKTVCTILQEAGAENISVDINSIGDKECRPQYIRELTNYYKKHLKEDQLAQNLCNLHCGK